ncbi:suppressor of cytokine signaling 2-like [Ostrea edulis]|uniref:suppressor of cytokine signaling 2-like n=1 Tax=Ostrea edulis TaxID=37623 RepID=UPI0024AF9EB8|nr:suppressor of cytokine signaling 2-like [Ostrea edulis]
MNNIVMNGRPQDDPCESKQSKTVRDPAYYCAKDMTIQIRTAESLAQTGWYYEHFTRKDAKCLLQKETEGTFLIRDSSDSRYLYSLSVKTGRDATSVRILYRKGKFRMDCDESSRVKMPTFDSAVGLVDFYARMTQMGKSKAGRWLESSGKRDLPIVLQKPKLNCVSDLKHLCRLSINRNLPKTQNRTKVLNSMDKLPIPRPLKSYLKDYPHII